MKGNRKCKEGMGISQICNRFYNRKWEFQYFLLIVIYEGVNSQIFWQFLELPF